MSLYYVKARELLSHVYAIEAETAEEAEVIMKEEDELSPIKSECLEFGTVTVEPVPEKDEDYVRGKVAKQKAEDDELKDELKSWKAAFNLHEDLVPAYGQVEGGFLDALRALNDAGLPCPASLGLAMEKVREIIASCSKKTDTLVSAEPSAPAGRDGSTPAERQAFT